MKDLGNETFRIDEGKDEFLDSYSDMLNFLVKVRYDKKSTTKIIANALNVSEANISSLEKMHKNDVKMLFKYAAIFGYRIEMRVVEKTHSEKMGYY